MFPSHAVAVGDVWRGKAQISDEQLALGYNHGQSNQDPRRGNCVYRLRSVDARKRSATISFAIAASLSSASSWNHVLIKRSVRESGEGRIDLGTGVPTKFEARKRTVWRAGLKSEGGTEITHTTMVLRIE